jgi:hypothetical protein
MSNTLDHFDIPTNSKDRNTNFKAKCKQLKSYNIRNLLNYLIKIITIVFITCFLSESIYIVKFKLIKANF